MPAKIASRDGDVHDNDGGTGLRTTQRLASPRRPRRPRTPPSRAGRIFRWVAGSLAVLLVGASLSAYLKYRSIWDSITRYPVAGLGEQPAKLTSAMNILLIGSDTRSGTNHRFGANIDGQRSDTIIVLHIAPHHKGVIVLSIPRDSVVPVLSCPPEPGTPGQSAQPGQVEQINATFAAGGPGCLFKTVEQTTHLHLDHFIELTFTGFEQVINDIGGVSICLPFAVSDPESQLHLSAGRHHVDGALALAFWRARYIGDGSDLQRIQRDQYLMASVVQGVQHSRLLSSPAKLLTVSSDAAKSMTTDSGLTVGAMVGIVQSLRSMPASDVQFIELPTVAYQPNPNWVSWPASDAALFSALAHDRALPPTSGPGTPGGSQADGQQATAQHEPVEASELRTRHAAPPDMASTYGGITGSTNVCKDAGAFAGPRGGT